MKSLHVIVSIALVGMVTIFSCGSSRSETFPNRPIRLVVPFAPGGPTDLSARMIATKMADVMGQNIIVDNRPGAGGSLGTQIVVNSNADGYTMLLCSSSVMVLNPLLSVHVQYRPLRDLTPLSIVTSSPFVLLTNPSLPAKTVKELIDMAKSKPDSMTFGSGGVGTGGHLAGEMFRSMAGIKISHIPYKGSGPANVALIGGHVQMAFASISSSLPSITGGRLIALGVSSRKRSAVLPQIPTIIESGLPGYEVTSWQGICAPGGTPSGLVTTLNRAIAQAVQDPAIAERFSKLGVDATASSPNEFVAFVKAETSRWAKVIQEIGVKPQ